jgi:hypothetical protein
VADKKRIGRTIKNLQRVKTWQLVILLVLAGFIAATFLRLNSVGMAQRRDAVMVADKEGDSDKIIERLSDLQQYVSSHMNTSMSQGLYLLESYKRAAKQAEDAASQDENPNGNIYKKAKEVCAPRFTVYTDAYLQCTLGELNKYPAGSVLIDEVNYPDPNLYRHQYYSPLWTPDFAGFAVLTTIIIALMIVARTISLIILRLLLYRHYRSA